MANLEFIKEMNLTKGELETFERYINTVEAASKNRVGFQDPDKVVFTIEATFLLAVVKFAYDVYKDYRNGWLMSAEEKNPEFEMQMKTFIRELHQKENEANAGGDAPGLDSFARMRKAVRDAKKSKNS